ncbi:ester cyclase [Amycolatopsis vastitatis]|uniref:Ester cyclase n=1 Tax=Amycolatopsis vastitatis TaxID=1905142 RepID=A0A229T4F5_9PSEU|nr:ester cyclase [Amycolatopsis vastitatis]OXM65890.1 hypothetical protein CF165_21125 [Amycolatopsis vastitatis]
MTTAENTTVLQSFVRTVLDGKDLPAAEKFLSRNFLHHDRAPGEDTGQQTGLAGTQSFLANTVFTAFSQFDTTFEDVVAEGDLVAARWHQTSVNTGAWLGRPATGSTVDIAGISIVRVRDGLIVEEWEARDSVSMLRQLGVALPRLTVLPGAAAAPPPEFTPAPFRANGPLVGGELGLLDLKSLVASLFASVYNSGNVGLLQLLLAPGYVLHDPTGLLPGTRNGIAGLVATFRSGMPDFATTVDLQLAQGDRVVTRWTGRGTHKGTLFGIAATGVPVSVSGISVARARGTQIQEEWLLWDQLSLLQQVAGGPF